MFLLLTASALVLALGGTAAGIFLACRFAWPRKLYDALLGGRR